MGTAAANDVVEMSVILQLQDHPSILIIYLYMHRHYTIDMASAAA